MARPAPWLPILSFASGGILVALLVALLSPDAATEDASTADAALLAELQRLRISVEKLSGAATPASPSRLATDTGPAASARQPDLTPVLLELTQALTDLRFHLENAPGRTGGAAGISRARNTHAEADWSLLLPLAVQMTRDDETAKTQVRLLTPAELLDRYGPPSNVWASGNSSSVTWHYARTGMVNGELEMISELNFRIMDGYVIDAWGHDDATAALMEAAGD